MLPGLSRVLSRPTRAVAVGAVPVLAPRQNGRACFNIGGGKYRLIVHVRYDSRARVSEVLGGKRRLTLEMIRRLHERFGLPSTRASGGEDTAQG